MFNRLFQLNLLRSAAACLTLALLLLFSQTSHGQTFDPNKSPLPPPTSPVMDYAGVIDAATEARLEKKILDFAESSEPKVELGVVTVDSTDGVDIFDYSLAVAVGWGIGTKNEDNPGALLLVAIKDRKYFTQVGSDLEDELPDGRVGLLQRQYLVPELKLGNYSKGIEDTIDSYISAVEAAQRGETLRDDYQPEKNSDEDVGAIDGSDIVCCLVIIISIVIFFVATYFRAGKNMGGGGGGGGRRKRRTGRDMTSAAGEVAIDVIGSILIGAITGGGSGSSSDSSWGGSSGGGGGFGGFGGGGDFGGGGAGGSW